MSEAYCVVMRVAISREGLVRFLGAGRRKPSSFGDWERCEGFVDPSEVGTPGWAAWLAELDGYADGTNREGFGRIRGGAGGTRFRFRYDEASGVLEQASIAYGQGATELVDHLGLSRGIADFLEGEESGFVAVHDPWLGNGTVAFFELGPGVSRLVHADPSAPLPRPLAARLAAFDADFDDFSEVADPAQDRLDAFG